ncbi:MAG: DUF2283 domain-containing protein [Nanoarchaeota archaeon]|nr:DUF2283 domain-containing protein [Nanoarchaeota archaeon]MBU1005094.1 DUF2283 domain-containing protein [Nanoarchaeota archaeon]MBU1946436.1 DUF2283 domain-containing protein [Nanoarchaeota archaeon]
MAKADTKIIYDEEEDILSLSRSRKIKASIDIGDFIIDIDHDGFVAGIEILNASENLKISADQLKDLRKASMAVTYKPNYVYITLVMLFKDKEKDLAIPLTVDLGHMSVSTQNMNFAAA